MSPSIQIVRLVPEKLPYPEDFLIYHGQPGRFVNSKSYAMKDAQTANFSTICYEFKEADGTSRICYLHVNSDATEPVPAVERPKPDGIFNPKFVPAAI